jgi:hypothetical protein
MVFHAMTYQRRSLKVESMPKKELFGSSTKHCGHRRLRLWQGGAMDSARPFRGLLGDANQKLSAVATVAS